MLLRISFRLSKIECLSNSGPKPPGLDRAGDTLNYIKGEKIMGKKKLDGSNN